MIVQSTRITRLSNAKKTKTDRVNSQNPHIPVGGLSPKRLSTHNKSNVSINDSTYTLKNQIIKYTLQFCNVDFGLIINK